MQVTPLIVPSVDWSCLAGAYRSWGQTLGQHDELSLSKAVSNEQADHALSIGFLVIAHRDDFYDLLTTTPVHTTILQNLKHNEQAMIVHASLAAWKLLLTKRDKCDIIKEVYKCFEQTSLKTYLREHS